MANVVYLVSSLPALSFAHEPPITMEEFNKDAEAQLSNKDWNLLQSIDLRKFEEGNTHSELEAFTDMLVGFRADIMEIRRAKSQKQSPSLMSLPQSILNLNPLQREEQIMKWQWDQLSVIETGETFSFTVVAVYKLKLQIVSRLNSFDTERGAQVLSSVVDPPKQEES